ncbi:MAG: metalloregulator ArsR/SmtB family transcription factor [Syntrophorhabdus sp.]
MPGDQDMKVFELQADVCAALGNSRRLQILNLLKDSERSVSQMIDAMGINKANMSQHLTILRQKGLVIARRDGTSIYYRLTSPRISEACSIMREVLVETLREKERIAQQLRADAMQR